MGAAENAAQVKGLYEAYDAGEIDKVLEFNKDVTWENFEDNPFRGKYEGSEGTAEYLTFLNDNVDLTQFEVEKIIADEDTVVAIVDISYTVKDTGKATPGGPTIHIFDFEDDRAVRVREVAAGDGGAFLP